MIKVAGVLGGLLSVAYLVFPEARELVAASAPILLSLICPVSMIIMMLMMRKTSGTQPSAPAEAQPRSAPHQPMPGAQPAQASEAAAP